MERKLTLANHKESVSPLTMSKISIVACAILPNKADRANIYAAPFTIAIKRKDVF